MTARQGVALLPTGVNNNVNNNVRKTLRLNVVIM